MPETVRNSGECARKPNRLYMVEGIQAAARHNDEIRANHIKPRHPNYTPTWHPRDQPTSNKYDKKLDRRERNNYFEYAST
jgi:hypothetical protein